jgi:hypothetical protein
MHFPVYRPRRLRRTEALRGMIRETELNARDFIYPLFVVPGKGVLEALVVLHDKPIERGFAGAALAVDSLGALGHAERRVQDAGRSARAQ